ncbi:hypothetical protein AV530_009339 [Patagioenas fasciata monilis]|uniref:Uncharacterized protein n=1 Tax=Patagioenas fasciata monilis TaxID=372326 RepID=A0A1V4JJS2_PATFA|nr:hypothetical protein AV530_009339 [Patagioenas fasciata monilis]
MPAFPDLGIYRVCTRRIKVVPILRAATAPAASKSSSLGSRWSPRVQRITGRGKYTKEDDGHCPVEGLPTQQDVFRPKGR